MDDKSRERILFSWQNLLLELSELHTGNRAARLATNICLRGATLMWSRR